jgi:hypothetical protein
MSWHAMKTRMMAKTDESRTQPALTPGQIPLFTEDLGSAQAYPDAPVANGDFSHFVVYVDESGDHGMQNLDPHYPVFVLAFCVFHKRYYSEKVVPALHRFKFRHFWEGVRKPRPQDSPSLRKRKAPMKPPRLQRRPGTPNPLMF